MSNNKNYHQVIGYIRKIYPTEQITERFKKRRVLVEEARIKFPQTVELAFINNNCDKLDDYKTGQEVRIAFRLRGNEHKGKNYVWLEAWYIEAHAYGRTIEDRKRDLDPRKEPVIDDEVTDDNIADDNIADSEVANDKVDNNNLPF